MSSAGAGPGGNRLADSRRQLVARLLFPRTRELFTKWLLLPVGAVLGFAVRGEAPDAGEVLQVLVLWVVAEQLAYQARYQVNDLRDRAADAQHPAGARRGRLSFPWTRWRAALVWGSIGVRAAAAVLLTALVLTGPAQEAAAWFLGLLVVVSTAYEVARDRVRREVVVPGSARARRLGLPVVALIPLGYGLRVWAGYHAAGPGGVGLAVLLVVCVLLLSAATTLLAWALEGTTFLAASDTGGVLVSPRLGHKAHIAALVDHAGLLVRAAGPGRPPVVASRLALGRDRPSPRGRPAVWDVAAAVALGLSHAFVGLAATLPRAAVPVCLAAGLGTAAAPWLARLARRPPAGPWDGRASWLGGGALPVTVALEAGLLVVVVCVLAVVQPAALLLAWFPAWALFQWAAMRTSSYERGFGPLSLVRRPLGWWRARRAPGP